MTGSDLKPADKIQGKYVSTSFTGWKLQTDAPVKNNQLLITLNTDQFESVKELKKKLDKTNQEVKTINEAKVKS